ncbi:hypothetical protein ACHAWT_000660 [Skeletonema menzelii]
MNSADSHNDFDVAFPYALGPSSLFNKRESFLHDGGMSGRICCENGFSDVIFDIFPIFYVVE